MYNAFLKQNIIGLTHDELNVLHILKNLPNDKELNITSMHKMYGRYSIGKFCDMIKKLQKMGLVEKTAPRLKGNRGCSYIVILTQRGRKIIEKEHESVGNNLREVLENVSNHVSKELLGMAIEVLQKKSI